MKSKKETAIKVLVEIARLILGITFIFSGFVKAVDPFGTAYKIEDYMAAFDMSSFAPIALFLSSVLCLAEFLMGAFMLLGIYRRWNSRLVLLTMLFMTPLTLYLAIADPVSDCGCFGDAFVISNWETFFKNVVLLTCAIFLVFNCERVSNFFTGKTYWIAFLYLVVMSVLFVFHNYLFDPIFDFRPYKVGTNIPENMNVEEGKGRVEETILIYAKDGVKKEFTDQDAPWDDASWEYVDMKTKLVTEGEKPTIQDFSINQLTLNKTKTEVETMQDITQNVLADTSYVFLMITPHLDKMSPTYLSHFEDVNDYARDQHYNFYCLTASGSEEILNWSRENTIDFNFCNTDERELKTIIRSNPGLLLLRNGVIVNKWADIQVPAEEDLTAPLQELWIGQMIDVKAKDNRNLLYISLVFILPLLLLKLFDLLTFGHRKREEAKKQKEISSKE